MRASLALPPALVVAAALGATGCRYGEVQFSSTVTGRSFDPGGTVFSYLDATDDNLQPDANPRVAVAMTWIVFDPNSDLNDLDGSALADYSHELKLRDALAIVFDHQSDVVPHATFQSTVVNGEEKGDGKVRAVVHLAPERLTSTSTYADIVPFASKRITDVTVTSIDFHAAQPVLAADVTITFTRADSDPGDARQGAFTGSFQAPLAAERVAEQNLALLDVQDVMGLPLPPRGQP